MEHPAGTGHSVTGCGCMCVCTGSSERGKKSRVARKVQTTTGDHHHHRSTGHYSHANTLNTHLHTLNTTTTVKSSVTDTQSPTSTEDKFPEICNIFVGVVIISAVHLLFFPGWQKVQPSLLTADVKSNPCPQQMRLMTAQKLRSDSVCVHVIACRCDCILKSFRALTDWWRSWNTACKSWDEWLF